MQTFLSNFERNHDQYRFGVRLLSALHTQGEVTEAHAAAVAADCGLSVEAREEVIDAAVDCGILRSTQLESRLCGGMRSVPCLVLCDKK